MSTSLVPESPAPVRLYLSWQELDRLVADLAERLDQGYDRLLAVSRGGLVPAGMLAYRLGIHAILVANIHFYGPDGPAADGPCILSFPEADLLRNQRVLIIDEVWETGLTMAAVAERVRREGGQPISAVLHYKPSRSRVGQAPDYFAATTDHWVVYPYKAGQ